MKFFMPLSLFNIRPGNEFRYTQTNTTLQFRNWILIAGYLFKFAAHYL